MQMTFCNKSFLPIQDLTMFNTIHCSCSEIRHLNSMLIVLNFVSIRVVTVVDNLVLGPYTETIDLCFELYFAKEIMRVIE